MFKSILFLIAIVTVSANVKVLTSENWGELEGKKSFVKLYAPWCGHCKKLAPVWEDLAEKYPDVTIGEMDCTASENKAKCGELGVQGYPTLLYSTGFANEKYQGGRSLTELSTFVENELAESCLDDESLCSAEDKALLNGFASVSLEELQAQIETMEDEKKAANQEFDDVVQELNSRFKAAKDKKESTNSKLSRTLGYAKFVLSRDHNKDEL